LEQVIVISWTPVDCTANVPLRTAPGPNLRVREFEAADRATAVPDPAIVSASIVCPAQTLAVSGNTAAAIQVRLFIGESPMSENGHR
jgi:hypothetical protein